MILFTPGFSLVCVASESTGNRLNGFPIRLEYFGTWLKPGGTEKQ